MGARIGFRLLGPLKVVDGGAVVTIAANKQRVILSAPLLRTNRVVPLDDLVDRLWAQPVMVRTRRARAAGRLDQRRGTRRRRRRSASPPCR